MLRDNEGATGLVVYTLSRKLTLEFPTNTMADYVKGVRAWNNQIAEVVCHGITLIMSWH